MLRVLRKEWRRKEAEEDGKRSWMETKRTKLKGSWRER